MGVVQVASMLNRTVSVANRLLGSLQIFGGWFAFYVLLVSLEQSVGIWGMFLALGLATVGAIGAWCGIKLLEGNCDAIADCMWYWAIQIPIVATSALSAQVWLGVEAPVLLAFSSMKVSSQMNMGAEVTLQLGGGQAANSLGVNAFALLAAGYFRWLRDARSSLRA